MTEQATEKAQVIDWEARISQVCTWVVLTVGLALYGLFLALKWIAVGVLFLACHGADWAARGVAELARVSGEDLLAYVASECRHVPTGPAGAADQPFQAAPGVRYVVVFVAPAPGGTAEQPVGVWS